MGHEHAFFIGIDRHIYFCNETVKFCGPRSEFERWTFCSSCFLLSLLKSLVLEKWGDAWLPILSPFTLEKEFRGFEMRKNFLEENAAVENLPDTVFVNTTNRTVLKQTNQSVPTRFEKM